MLVRVSILYHYTDLLTEKSPKPGHPVPQQTSEYLLLESVWGNNLFSLQLSKHYLNLHLPHPLSVGNKQLCTYEFAFRALAELNLNKNTQFSVLVVGNIIQVSNIVRENIYDKYEISTVIFDPTTVCSSLS